mmetsp:Transcript_46262/g.52556  ORF Transcript_46262/g.52556 Transcript_46262/m.52556 type:complete len:122 (+) Transcript_46262:466-831(+)
MQQWKTRNLARTEQDYLRRQGYANLATNKRVAVSVFVDVDVHVAAKKCDVADGNGKDDLPPRSTRNTLTTSGSRLRQIIRTLRRKRYKRLCINLVHKRHKLARRTTKDDWMSTKKVYSNGK